MLDNTITALRRRYTQLFVVGLLVLSLCAMLQSMTGGLSEFNANLWARKVLIAHFVELKLKIGDRVFSQALVSKDGWLEYTGYENLDGYQNATVFPQRTLENMQQRIQKLYKVLHKRNITLMLVIPPNKATIYPDKLPDQIRKIGTQSNLSLFAAYLQQQGPPILLDLRPALQDARREQDVYYKTDTHWNTFGAFIAYTEIMKTLSKTYPQLVPQNIDEFKITNRKPALHDIAKLMGVTNVFMESGLSFTPIKKIDAQKKDLPTLLMYTDSFGDGLRTFLSPHFRKVTVISSSASYPDVSLERMEAIKPDIVIIEVVERSFNIHILDTFLKQVLMGRY